MQPRPPFDQRSSRLQAVEELGEVFDRCVAGYYWAVDHEEWTAVWEYAELIAEVHGLAEKVAA